MTELRSIRAVSFDAGGTLIHPWPSVGAVYAAVAAEHGHAGLPVDRINRQFAEAWRARKDFQHSVPEWADLVDRAFHGMVPTPPSRTFFPALYERFASPGAWRIFDDAPPVLDELASRGIRLAVVSNWDERLRPLLRLLRLESYFETVAVSCELGFSKPSPVIFQTAARRLGLPMHAILHVGDSSIEDVQAARDAGMMACQIDRQQPSQPPELLSSLSELLALPQLAGSA